MITKCVFSSR